VFVNFEREIIARRFKSIHSRGRWRLDNPEESWEKSDAEEGDWARLDVRIASRILVSSFREIISAALPLGQRI
jgi:hypothetical protein